MDATAQRRLEQVLLLALVLAVFAVSLTFGFVWDDRNLILHNGYLRQTDTLWKAFTSDFWALTNNPHPTGFYRPLITVSYWCELRLWGTASAAGYHATNLLAHLLATLLVWRLGRRLGLAPRTAWIAAALFGVHPLQAMAVSNISFRTDLFACALLLGAVLLWLREDAWRWASLPLLLAAMLCKESALVGPLLCVGCAWSVAAAPAGAAASRPPPPSRLLAWAPLASWGVYALLRVLAIGLGKPDEPGPWQGGVYLLRYLGRMLLPVPGVARTPALAPGAALIALSLFVWVTLLAALFHRGLTPRARLVLGWFTLAMVPVSELLPLGLNFYDPLAYLPFVAVALGLGLLCERWLTRRWLAPACAGLLLLYAALSVHSALAWKDNLALWSRALRLYPEDAQINLNYGNALRQAGQAERGCRHLARALALRPPERLTPYLHYNLGNCARGAGDHALAAERYRQALRASGGEMLQARHNLALSLLALGQLEDALASAEELVSRSPRLASAWKLLGVTRARLRRFPAAAAAFERALALDPRDQRTRAMLEEARRGR